MCALRTRRVYHQAGTALRLWHSYGASNSVMALVTLQIRQVTQKLLSYARHCFEDDEYESRLCDTFTSGITLLITLRARGIEGMSSLLDISDPYKSNQLCTILVNNGMAKEALEFAPKCSVHVAEVWAAWGFKCLREYDYTEAREKFAQYFAISDPDERQLTVLSDIKVLATHTRNTTIAYNTNRQLNALLECFGENEVLC